MSEKKLNGASVLSQGGLTIIKIELHGLKVNQLYAKTLLFQLKISTIKKIIRPIFQIQGL